MQVWKIQKTHSRRGNNIMPSADVIELAGEHRKTFKFKSGGTEIHTFSAEQMAGCNGNYSVPRNAAGYRYEVRIVDSDTILVVIGYKKPKVSSDEDTEVFVATYDPILEN